MKYATAILGAWAILLPAIAFPEGEAAEQEREANELLTDAASVVEQMKQDEDLAGLMDEARGVFIVPRFGRGAVIVGARGGEGVLLTQDSNARDWNNPVFYDTGSVSFGAQIGGSGGAVAMLLMSDEAVKEFMQDNNFSINAEAGLTIIDYSKAVEAAAGMGDIVYWSDQKGAYAGAALSVTDVNLDEEENRAIYGDRFQVDQVIEGKARMDVRNRHVENLKQKLSG